MDPGRILDRLEEAEQAEQDIWYRQDYRQAFIVCSLAERGEPEPFVTSSYRIYATHPDKVWAKIMHDRRMKLGREFSDWFDQAGNRKPDVPKKKPAIYIDEQAERAARERLAGVLAFPKTALQVASGAEAQKTGNLIEMPSAVRIAARQSLRILPA